MLRNKFWQAFFAIGPIAMLVLGLIGYFVFLFMLISRIDHLEHGPGNFPENWILGNLGIIVFFVLIAVLISFGSLIYYIVHAAYNPNLKQNNLLLVWILLFIFANGLGQLIYWIMEVVGKRDQQES